MRKTSFLIILVLAFSAAAQSPEPDAFQETVEVDLVDLYFTATDSKGRFINDLTADEITVKEDGAPQDVLRFGAFAGERNEIPVLLSLLIDNSASMDEEIQEVRKLDLARDASLVLLDQLGPLDRSMVVRFSDKPVYSELTSDKEAVGAILKSMKPYWWHTALFDATASTITTLSKHSGRKILLLCSDGQDNMSETKLEDLLKIATDSPELTIVVFGTVSNRPARSMRGGVKDIPASPMFHGKEVLQQLADTTAGYAFFPNNLKEADKVFELIRSFVRSQYYLAYRPQNRTMDGAFRKIQLVCKRKGVTLHYRPGYNAPRS